MKALLFISSLLFFFLTATTQPITPEALDRLSPLKKEEAKEYLQEAKDYKTAGLVMLPVGIALTAGGALIIANYNSDYPDEEKQADEVKMLGMIGIGVLCIIGSVPSFMKSINRRHKARAIIFADKDLSLAPKVVLPYTRSYGIRIVIPFGGK